MTTTTRFAGSSEEKAKAATNKCWNMPRPGKFPRQIIAVFIAATIRTVGSLVLFFELHSSEHARGPPQLSFSRVKKATDAAALLEEVEGDYCKRRGGFRAP